MKRLILAIATVACILIPLSAMAQDCPYGCDPYSQDPGDGSSGGGNGCFVCVSYPNASNTWSCGVLHNSMGNNWIPDIGRSVCEVHNVGGPEYQGPSMCQLSGSYCAGWYWSMGSLKIGPCNKLNNHWGRDVKLFAEFRSDKKEENR